jgi:hypothetical protein
MCILFLGASHQTAFAIFSFSTNLAPWVTPPGGGFSFLVLRTKPLGDSRSLLILPPWITPLGGLWPRGFLALI